MNAQSSPSPLSARELVDEYFIENRTKLLEIAAFLDRLDRADPSYAGRDFRMKAFVEALAGLDRKSGRVDPSSSCSATRATVPLDALDRKSALGAYDRWSQEKRS